MKKNKNRAHFMTDMMINKFKSINENYYIIYDDYIY